MRKLAVAFLALFFLAGQKSTASNLMFRAFEGNKSPVTITVFSHDNKTLASGNQNGEIVLSDFATGKAKKILKGHSEQINGLAFNASDHFLVSGSKDGKALLWDVLSGEKIANLEGHTGSINGVLFHPGGRFFVTASADATIVIWDLATREKVRTFRGHQGGINDIAFTSAGETLVSADAEGKVIFWDFVTGRKERILDTNSSPIDQIAISSDGKKLACLNQEEKRVALWDVLSQKSFSLKASRGMAEEGLLPGGFTCGLCFSGNNSLLFAGTTKNAKIFDVNTGQNLGRFSATSLVVSALALSPDENFLVMGSIVSPYLFVWDRKQLNHYVVQVAADCLALDQTGQYLFVGKSLSGEITTWLLGAARVPRQPRKGETLIVNQGFTAIASSPIDQTLAVGGDSGVALWDWPKKELIRNLAGPGRKISFSADGKQLAAISDSLAIWDLENEKLLEKKEISGLDLMDIFFAPNGDLLLTGSNMAQLVFWNKTTKSREDFDSFGRLLVKPISAFSPDGKLLMISPVRSPSDYLTSGNQFLFWDIAKRKVVGEGGVLGDGNNPRAMSFSGGLQKLAACADNHAVQLFDVENWTTPIFLDGGADSLIFDSRGRFLVTGQNENTSVPQLTFWNLQEIFERIKEY